MRETAGQQVLGELHLACKDVFTFGSVPADPARNLQGTGMQKVGGSELLLCPSDLVAIGIRGRAGTYLDAFGLLCGPLPVAVEVKNLGKRDRSSSVLEATPTTGPSPFGEQVAAPDVVAARTGTMTDVSGGAQSTRRPCRAGFVWRLAQASDAVCVTPASRSDVANENGSAVERWDPTGAYGPKTCAAGYVWREAFEGDAVCVLPARRAAVRLENDQAASRSAGP